MISPAALTIPLSPFHTLTSNQRLFHRFCFDRSLLFSLDLFEKPLRLVLRVLFPDLGALQRKSDSPLPAACREPSSTRRRPPSQLRLDLPATKDLFTTVRPESLEGCRVPLLFSPPVRHLIFFVVFLDSFETQAPRLLFRVRFLIPPSPQSAPTTRRHLQQFSIRARLITFMLKPPFSGIGRAPSYPYSRSLLCAFVAALPFPCRAIVHGPFHIDQYLVTLSCPPLLMRVDFCFSFSPSFYDGPFVFFVFRDCST